MVHKCGHKPTSLLKNWGFTIHKCGFEKHTYKSNNNTTDLQRTKGKQRSMKIFLLETKEIDCESETMDTNPRP